MCRFVFFFFKQKTAYEMRISDWSSDVCSSDLLLPDVNLKLRPRILSELAPGTRVVSPAFTMGDWDSDQYETVDGRSLYLWIVPARVAGTWQIQHPGGPITEIGRAYSRERVWQDV